MVYFQQGLVVELPVTDPVNSVSLVDISSRRIYSAVSKVAVLADHWRQFKSGWEWKCNVSWLWRWELVVEVRAGCGGESSLWRWELVVEVRAGAGSSTHVSLPSAPLPFLLCVTITSLTLVGTVIRDFVYGKEPVVLESSFFIFWVLSQVKLLLCGSKRETNTQVS